MKKFSLFLMIVLLVSAIFISCSAEPAADATSVAEVAIDFSKVLSASSEQTTFLPDVDTLYWYYTATKPEGFQTGATSAKTAIRTDNDGKGLPALIGQTETGKGQFFSLGTWSFAFYGYTAEQVQAGAPTSSTITAIYSAEASAVEVSYPDDNTLIGGDAVITLSLTNDPRTQGTVKIENIAVNFNNAIDSSDYTLTVTASGLSAPIATSVVNGSTASNGTITFFSQAYEIDVSNTAASNVIAPRFYTLSFAVTKAGDSSNTYASGEISIHARLGYTVTIDGDLNSLESVAYVQIINNTTGTPQAQNENVFTISTEDELRAFAAYVNQGNDCEGMVIKLANDITLHGDWTPIGNSYRGQVGENDEIVPYFAGTFDGDGNSISGLRLASDAEVAKDSNREYVFGLFGVVKNATIKNLTMLDVQINQVTGLLGENVAAVVGYSEGSLTLENITVGAESEDNSYIKGQHVAGIISRAYGKSMDATITINNCTNYAAITATNGSDNKAKAAGIAAYVSGQGANRVYVTNCKNYGVLESSAELHAIAAGIVNYGFNDNYSDHYEVKANNNEGNITLLEGAQGYLYAQVSNECNDGYVYPQDVYVATNNTSSCTVIVDGSGVSNVPLVRVTQGGTEVNTTVSE